MAARYPVRPKLPACQEKQQLVDEFIAAAREIIQLQNEQMKAVVDEVEGVEPKLNHALRLARKRKEEAMRAYARHLEKHGC